jgi:hypothetical protein
MKRFFVATLIFAATLSADEVARRQERQQDRIAQGVGSGELTPRETARLERREAALNRTVRRDRRSGGGLDAQEKRQINRRQNHISRGIYRQKHDAQKQ